MKIDLDNLIEFAKEFYRDEEPLECILACLDAYRSVQQGLKECKEQPK